MAEYSIEGDKLALVIELRDLPEALEFNCHNSPDNVMKYTWGAFIENNESKDNWKDLDQVLPNSWDYALQFSYFKPADAQEILYVLRTFGTKHHLH